MNIPFWTDKLVTSLAEMIADGHTYTDIGRQLGCSKNAAIGKARRLGIDVGPGPFPTLHDRMDAEHARMDAVLAETRAAIEEHYEPVYRGEWTEERRLKLQARLRALNGNGAQRGVV